MKRIACHTLGCKVNQYDTQAMLEAFERAGYTGVGFEEEAEVYLINTCTVTGTGDQKSMKLIRRVHRSHPEAAIVVAGCLAQRDAPRVMLPGVRLAVGAKRRGEVAELLERALRENVSLSAVDADGEWTFERLSVERHEGHTRATMKIQEGCDRYCSYCIIPYVRGPIRSMPLEAVRAEAETLAEALYLEVVLTGIHLASYGRETGLTLMDAVRAVHESPVRRIRLGSLEPTAVDDATVQALAGLYKVCPQFHLSMQSGSDGVLRRMRRRYDAEGYLAAARRLQRAFPLGAITTDVLTGFPGETEQEAEETERFLREVGFARIHVFPYSRRAGTAADAMPDQVPEAVKQARAARLIAIGNELEASFVQKLVGKRCQVLFETALTDGIAEGYTEQYARVRAKAAPGELKEIFIERVQDGVLIGRDPFPSSEGRPEGAGR